MYCTPLYEIFAKFKFRILQGFWNQKNFLSHIKISLSIRNKVSEQFLQIHRNDCFEILPLQDYLIQVSRSFPKRLAKGVKMTPKKKLFWTWNLTLFYSCISVFTRGALNCKCFGCGAYLGAAFIWGRYSLKKHNICTVFSRLNARGVYLKLGLVYPAFIRTRRLFGARRLFIKCTFQPSIFLYQYCRFIEPRTKFQ